MSEQILGLETDHRKLTRIATKKRKRHENETVTPGAVQDYEESGWEIEKVLNTKTRMRRELPIDKFLENRVWLLFYMMGFPEIGGGSTCKIRIQRREAEPLYKQIDVIARDEETVLVIECKASERMRKRSLQKDIEEFANLKGPISKSVKSHYGKGFKPKIIWLFVTSNIIWSSPDKKRAEGENIGVIDERDLRYYMQVADHLRYSARFQFLAEFLKNQKIPEMSEVTVPAIRGKLGGKPFYSFVTNPKRLLKIAFVNHRSLNDPEGAPSYQRLVSRTRLKQISDFLKKGGFFPTNILINFVQKARFERIAQSDDSDITFGTLHLPNKYKSAWIIDGQHRLYGFSRLDEDLLNTNIMVVAFEALTQVQEANLFVEINHEQKSVPKTLLDDLEGELKWESDVPSERIGAIAARLINLLNSDLGEPFYGRVTRQGIVATETTCLTVPALKDAIKKSRLLGSVILKGKAIESGPFSGVNDSETLDRARRALNVYFEQIRTANSPQWDFGRKGSICTNVAIQGYILLLSELIGYMETNKGLAARELEAEELIAEIEDYFDPILKMLSENSHASLRNRFTVPHGGSGPREYLYRLCTVVNAEFSDFLPEGFEDWLQGQSEERIEEADRMIKDLNVRVQRAIFSTLRDIHGDNLWDDGVGDPSIQTKAYSKSLEDPTESRLEIEHYLDFIEYKKIVEKKINWPTFKDRFDIPAPGEKGKAKNLAWMDRINEIRRIPAHATEHRNYKKQDFEDIEYYYNEFISKNEVSTE